MQIIPHNVSLMFFFSHLLKCLCVIIDIYAYFIYISQNSVETHLRCGEPVKNFENRSIIGEDMDKSKVPRFYMPTLY